MALRGTGSSTNGWTRPFYLSSASMPITMACWVLVPNLSPNSGFWGLGSANALSFLDYLNDADLAGGGYYWDQYDDTAAAGNMAQPQIQGFAGDGNWHHVAVQVKPTSPGPGTSSRLWFDGVNATPFNDDIAMGIGTQTFTSIQIGVAPTSGSEPAFLTTTQLAELCVFTPGTAGSSMDNTIQALALGYNPLRVPGAQNLRAYHPLRNNLQDMVGSRAGMRALGTPQEPVFLRHPNVDPVPLLRRMPITHISAVLAGTTSSADAGSGSLTSAIRLVGTGSQTNIGSAGVLASSLQNSVTLNRNSAIGALTAATHLIGTGTSANTSQAQLSGTAIPMQGTSTSINAAIGALTIPTPSAAALQLSNALIDSLVRGQPLQPPTVWFVALVTQLGDTMSPGIEVSGGNYARSAVPASLSSWSGTQGPGTTIASNGLTGLVSNNDVITFQAPTANWGIVVGYEFWDGNGNRWFSGKLGSSLNVSNGAAAPSFPIASLSIAIG